MEDREGIMKIAIISSCESCPHSAYTMNGIYWCNRALTNWNIKDGPIPEWCPLPDLPKQKTLIELLDDIIERLNEDDST